MAATASKVPESPPSEDVSDGFRHVSVALQGTTYEFKELEMIEYEACMKRAELPDGRSLDNQVLLKLMVAKSLQSPKLNAEALSHLPTSVMRKLNDLVNDLHFQEAETDEEKAKREAAEAEEAAKADLGELPRASGLRPM